MTAACLGWPVRPGPPGPPPLRLLPPSGARSRATAESLSLRWPRLADLPQVEPELTRRTAESPGPERGGSGHGAVAAERFGTVAGPRRSAEAGCRVEALGLAGGAAHHHRRHGGATHHGSDGDTRQWRVHVPGPRSRRRPRRRRPVRGRAVPSSCCPADYVVAATDPVLWLGYSHDSRNNLSRFLTDRRPRGKRASTPSYVARDSKIAPTVRNPVTRTGDRGDHRKAACDEARLR